MTTIGNDGVTGVTMDGDAIGEITMDGDTVWTAGSDVTVLDDFEDGDISEYSGQTSGYDVQGTTVPEGSWAVESNTTFVSIAHDSQTTPAGYEYRCRTQWTASDARVDFVIQAQDPTTPRDTCYQIFWTASNTYFGLRKRTNGSAEWTVYSNDNVTLDPDTEYHAAVEYDSNGTDVRALLYDATGTRLSETAWQTDSNPLTGGTFGFYTDSSGTVFDYVTQRSQP